MNNDLAGLTVRIDADIDPIKSKMRETAQLGAQFGRSISSAFEDAVFKGKDLGDVLKNLALSFSKIAFKAAFKPLEQAAGNFFSQILGGGGDASSGGFSLFAKGGVVAAPTAFSLGSGKTGIAGEAGPEAILPLTRGADGRLGVRQSGGGRRSLSILTSERRMSQGLKDQRRR